MKLPSIAVPLLLAVCGSAVGAGDLTQSPGPALLSPEVRADVDAARGAGLYRDPDPGVLSPGLRAHVTAAPGERYLAWVFFTDKGVGTEASYRGALERARETLSPRVLRRRSAGRDGPGMAFTDLPVYPPYVDALRESGLRVRRVSRWLDAASVEGTGDLIAALDGLPFVRRVQPVLVKRAPAGTEPSLQGPEVRGELPLEPGSTAACSIPPPADTLEAKFYGRSYNQLDQIQVLALQRSGYTGAGVRVMMLDTGFRKTHPVFHDARLIAEHDYVNNDGNTANEPGDPSSSWSHGTGTWAVLGGYGRGQLIGPAFAAEFVLAKTEDVSQEVHAEEDNYVAALEWADTLGVDVTSASLAYFTFDDSTGYTVQDLDGDTAVITVAVDLAAAKGITCVNAAGNNGPSATSIWTPADADTIISVGAADSCGTVVGFSSRGLTYDGRYKPEISARGVYTTWAVAGTNGYGLANGTSLATPLIGGMVVLLKEAHPEWGPWEIRAAVIGTGSQSGSPDNALGYGIAHGDDALTFGGSTPEPPRMTLPFHLLVPAQGSGISGNATTFVWTPSVAEQPGDQAHYLLLVDDSPAFASPDTTDAGTATSVIPTLAEPSGTTVWWKVIAVGNEGYPRESLDVRSAVVNPVSAVAEPIPVLAPWFLGPALPNPAVGGARVQYRAPSGRRVALEILDVAGRRVRRYEATGTGTNQEIRWDGRDATGRVASAGVYFYRLIGGEAPLASRFILVR